MKEIYSVEVDRYNPMALVHCLKKLNDYIPDFEYEWRVSANGGGIDYGLYLNINVERKEIEICNQPEFATMTMTRFMMCLRIFEEDEE